jgi:hypothetical protein
MKKMLCAVLFASALTCGAAAQGFYFDIGMGMGFPTTKVDGDNMKDDFGGSGIMEIGLDLGLKAGYGPFGGIPLYVVGEFGGMGHRFDDGADYVQFNSYLAGGGVIFYPIPLLQLAGSIGYSWTGNQSSLGSMANGNGFAWNVSIAADWGKRKHAALVGIKIGGSTNTLSTSVKQNMLHVGAFFRYAFRNKPAKKQ